LKFARDQLLTQSADSAPYFRAYVASGRRSEAVKLLNEPKKRSSPAYSDASEIATIYASPRDTDQAMNWLEKAYEERFNPGVLIRPGFDPLRSDPRFEDLLRRVGLPRRTGQFADGEGHTCRTRKNGLSSRVPGSGVNPEADPIHELDQNN